ncbi:hypothetical protein NIES4102_05660 [Chondrocystis sp. NIES-4102]|nr:hypothetical protein NIES4102_05660 [Chondrocystis sp. NIES-4102]
MWLINIIFANLKWISLKQDSIIRTITSVLNSPNQSKVAYGTVSIELKTCLYISTSNCLITHKNRRDQRYRYNY